VQVRLLSNMGSALAKISANSPQSTRDEERSRELFQKALTMQPKSSRLWLKYTQSLMDMKRYSEADRILTTINNGELPLLPARNGN
jgi:predicted Zn-dependent protease